MQRSITQRKKIKALGLEDIPLYISEEYKSEKPDRKRFKMIESSNSYIALHFDAVSNAKKLNTVQKDKYKWKRDGIRSNNLSIVFTLR